MSSTCSAASAASRSGSNEPRCGRLPSVKLSLFAKPFYASIGRISLAMTTSERLPQSDWPRMESGQLTLFAEGFPARTSAMQDSRRALKASDQDYGENTAALLTSYDQNLLSWKTSQRCLDGEWALFLETWPRSGLMRNGIAYQLPPLVPLTKETEYGLWATPRASEIAAKASMATVANIANPRGNLEEQVYAWGTPTSRDYKDSGNCSNVDENGLLGRMAKSSAGQTESEGSVNPEFHLWLMGFPAQWNEL